jgi:purine-nucleoside phosphorylase
MGIPSCLIYCAELINDYNAVDLVRVGTAGSLSDKLPTGSIIAVDRACSDSAALYRIINKCGPEFSGAFPKNSTLFENSFFPHEKLKLKALKTSEKLNIKTEEAPVFTSDHFYTPLPEKDYFKDISANKIFCIEMETAGLYAIASAHKVRALSLLTISDMIFDSSKSLSSEQKERGLEKMVKIALETLCT